MQGLVERRESGGDPCRLKLKEAAIHLTCVLCRGYLVDATTITECLHSFCKTCIVRYIAKNNHCPICTKSVHKSNPLHSLRPDDRLQNIVYKMVPGLHKAEMKRRRSFYSKYPTFGPASLEDGGIDMSSESARMIISADDDVSVSLEYHRPNLPPPAIAVLRNKVGEGAATTQHGAAHDHILNEAMIKRRYLSCPAAVTVAHIQKFVRNKFGLNHEYQIDVFHCNEVLESDLTLIDVAYIYSWKKKSPLGLSYLIRLLKKQSAPKISQTVTNKRSNEFSDSDQKKDCERVVQDPFDQKKIQSSISKTKNEERPAQKESKTAEKRTLDTKQIMGPPKHMLPKRPRLVAPTEKNKIKTIVTSKDVAVNTVPIKKPSPPKVIVSKSPAPAPVKRSHVLGSKMPEKPKTLLAMVNNKKPALENISKTKNSAKESVLQGICAKLPVKGAKDSKTTTVQSNAVSSQLPVKNMVNGNSGKENASRSAEEISEKQVVTSSTKDDRSTPEMSQESGSSLPNGISKVPEKLSTESESKKPDNAAVKETDQNVSNDKLDSSSSSKEVTSSLTINTSNLDDDDSNRNSCSDSGRGSDVSVCSSVDSDSSLVSPPISSVDSPPMLRIVTSPQPDEGIDMKNDKDDIAEPPAKVPKEDHKPSKEPHEEKKKKEHKSSQGNKGQSSSKSDDTGPLDLSTKPVYRCDTTVNGNSGKEWKRKQSQKHKSTYSVNMPNGSGDRTPLAYTHSAAASIPCPNKPLVVKITRKPMPVVSSRPPQYIPNTPVFYSRRPPNMHLDVPNVPMPPVCMGPNPHRNNHHHHKYKSSYK